jgi:hypothetical protein
MKYSKKVKYWKCDCPACNPPRRPLRQWLDTCPGGVSTLLVLVAVAAGMWGAWLIWQLRVGAK